MPRCFNCGDKFVAKKFLQKSCESLECEAIFRERELQKQKHKRQGRKPTRIKPVSEKRISEKIIYDSERIKFLQLPENSICFIEGCNKKATTIEHRAGRIGKNYLDTTTWAACCLEHNLELENNPELSKKYQLSKIHGGKKL